MTGPHALDDPFRPRRARVVALALAVLSVVALGTVAVLTPAETGIRLLDRVGIGAFALGLAWFCWRQATVRAVPDAGGLLVRNLFLTRRVEWTEIVSVRLGDRPWVQLDLAEGDTLAVMGIQRADGELARAESRRLATLVALHEGRQ